jgi:hypothetical protein
MANIIIPHVAVPLAPVPSVGINNNFTEVATKFNTYAVQTDVAKTITVAHTFAADILFTDALYDIGKTGATRPRDLFLSRNLVIGGSFTFGSLTMPLAQDLLFVDNTYDIGKNGATRPRDVWISRDLKVSNGFTVVGDALMQGNINGAAGKRIAIGSAFLGSYLGNYAEVGYNIDSGPVYQGADFASRVRFDSGGLNFDTAPSGAGGGAITFTTRFKVTQAGNFIAGTDAVSDIGASGANRPRDVFISRNFLAGGSITGGLRAAGSASNAGLVLDNYVATDPISPNHGELYTKTSELKVRLNGATKIVLFQNTQLGYTNPWTGVLNRATAYDVATVTLAQLAGRVAALQADLTAFPII